MSELTADSVGSAIVKHQRGARLADVTNQEWAARITNLIAAQSGVDGVTITDVREVGTAAGGSNGTLLFECNWRQNGSERSQGMVLRFLPTSGLFHVYDVRGQFELQRALEATDVPVPPQLWLDEAGKFLERPGYIMGQVSGASSPMTWMTSGIIAEARPDQRRRMTLGYLEALAVIHDVDWRALGLQWLERRAEGSKPIEREVNWYWDALLNAGVKSYIEALAPIRTWLIENEPEDLEIVLCHGDANFGNYLYVGEDVSAVVDWEMSFLGTRECDLTFIYIGDQILHRDVPWLEGALTYSERLFEYQRISGRELKNIPYFELFSAYRVAVINILTFKHFPPDVLKQLLPILERGSKIAAELAEKVGVTCHLPPEGTIA